MRANCNWLLLPRTSAFARAHVRLFAAILALGAFACGGSGPTPGPTPSPTLTPTPAPHAATTFYVAPNGSDSGPGTLAHPFATMRFAASQLTAGDVLYVRAGDYREIVTVPQSGTASAPITIEAYPGECPTLIGAALVPGPWTPHSGSIYKAAWPTQPSQVFSDGHLLNEARWPNTAVEDFAGMTYALADAGSSTSITSAGLPPVDLTGAWVSIMAGQAWVAYSRQVASHDRATGRLSFSSPVNALPELVPRRGNHFYLFGKLELLDSPGEWYWDPGERALYVWTPDDASPEGRVEAGTAPAVLDLSGQSYVTVKDLSARGGRLNLQNSSYCTVADCHLWAPNWTRTVDGYATLPKYMGGVDVSGTGNLVQGGSVRQAGRSGIHVGGTGNTVRQVTVEDCGWNWAAEFGINLNGADQAVVENNTVRRVAMAGIYLAPRSKFLNNLVERPCLFVEDCGNIVTWEMDGQGTEVAGNVLRHNPTRWGGAIYLDDGSSNFNVHDNLAEAILYNGIIVKSVNTIENNTFLDVQHQGICFGPGASAIGADWSAGRAAHNQSGEPFPLMVQLIQPALISDYGYFAAYTTLAPQPGPRRVELDWSQFAQPGWTQNQIPLDLSTVDSISFTMDAPATPFNYTIANLRLLPVGAAGDTGAAAVSGTTWTASGGSGSTCTLSASGSLTWGATGSSVFGGWNWLTAPLPAGIKNLAAYRGLAFELAGTASRHYDFQGYQDVDNGPEATAGRGASLPAVVGADPASAWPTCHINPTSR